jgi:hypothetical protein
MLKIIVTLTTLLLSTILLAQVSENREVAPFSKLQASQGIEVSYTISNTRSVKVETDNSEKLNYIKTEVENNVLKLYVNSKDYKTKKNKTNFLKINNDITINGIDFNILKITISGPNLESIKASSAATIKIENGNKTSGLDLAVSSSGSISGSFECSNAVVDASSSGGFAATINATTVEIESSSSADVVLSGKVKKITIKASSSADCKLKELDVEDAIIKASSSAAVVLTVTKSINATASSSAAITFYGNPSQIEKEISSSASISKK